MHSVHSNIEMKFDDSFFFTFLQYLVLSFESSAPFTTNDETFPTLHLQQRYATSSLDMYENASSYIQRSIFIHFSCINNNGKYLLLLQ